MSDKKCYVCGKDASDKCIEMDDKCFCCPDCVKQYNDENKSNKKDNVCEFC